MRPFVLAAVLVLTLTGPLCAAPPTKPAVLVELFTSQGCSSCPHADEVLSRLAVDPAFSGRVIPLEFHVDYWNSLGWSDPFSSAAWSARQQQYSKAFHGGQIYTPQLVIDGQRQLAGSLEADVRREIGEELAKPQSCSISASVQRPSGKPQMTIDASMSPAVSGARKLDVVLAIVESGRSTEVRNGENGGRTLHNDRIVRFLRRVGTVESGKPARLTSPLDIDRAWNPRHIEAVVFLQDPATMQVYGAAAVPL